MKDRHWRWIFHASSLDEPVTRRSFLGLAGALTATALAGCGLGRRVEDTAAAPVRAAEPPPLPPPPTTAPAPPLPPAPAKGDGILLLAGQSHHALGGRPDLGATDGYLDHVSVAPDGFTAYVGLGSEWSFYDAASMVVDPYLAHPALTDAVVHLSVPWIGEQDSDADTIVAQRRITDGSYDRAIDELGRWCASTPHPILLRLGYEFDRKVGVYYDPATYADSFRYIVDGVRAAGATNVATVLASTNHPERPLTREVFDAYYPGDDHVDWFGMSAYGSTFDEGLLLEARIKHKPVLIAESSPVGIDLGRRARFPLTTDDVEGEPLSDGELWDAWFAPFLAAVERNADVIGAVHYIAQDWSTDPYWSTTPGFAHCDGRVWVVPSILERWEQAVSSPPFAPQHPSR